MQIQIAKKIDKASSYFFFTGFFLSKLSHGPFPLLTLVFHILALLSYIGGYGLWLIATRLYKSQATRIGDKRLHDQIEAKYIGKRWYEWLNFNDQHLISSILGLLACGLNIIALFFPPLLLPAYAIFFVSNVIWLVGEYQKLNNPPKYDPDFSETRQFVYTRYAVIMTTVSLLVVISAATTVFFPVAAPFVIAATTILGIGLSLLAFEHYLDFTLGEHLPLAENEPVSPLAGGQMAALFNQQPSRDRKGADKDLQSKSVRWDSSDIDLQSGTLANARGSDPTEPLPSSDKTESRPSGSRPGLA